jgi:PKD repeat protein
MKTKLRFVELVCLSILLTVAAFAASTPKSESAQLEFNTNTDKLSYYLREKVLIQGTAKFNGVPVSDALVALEVHNPKNQSVAYRTASIGNPVESWVLEVTNIAMFDMSFQPLNTVKIGQTVQISVTVVNPFLTPRDNVVVALNLFDGNMIPLQALVVFQGRIDQKSNLTAYGTFYVPTWAYSGKANVYASVYDALPSSNGVPYLPETSAQFYISRVQQGLFTYYSSGITAVGSQALPGELSTNLRLPPNPEPGTYSVYSTVRFSSLYRTSSFTAFVVDSTPYPPTASFSFVPPNPYPNQTITFDGSSSSAEGFNDLIVRYEWDFGDGTPKVVKTGTIANPPDPTVTHKFLQVRSHVTLNATDTEGLSSWLTKTIITKATNPTAVFMWSPQRAIPSTPVTFNATNSLPGWSVRTGSSAPIAGYTWNFGDGNVTTVSTPIIVHKYAGIGNFTVTLEVVDTEGQRNSVSHIISVLNLAYPMWDINQDGKTDIKDLAIAAKAYGSTQGSPGWNPAADMNGDLKIDIKDLAVIAKHYGEVY